MVDRVSEQIMKIRNQALQELGAKAHTKCPTCGRQASSPFRNHHANGKVMLGCVDAFHTGHLVTPSESSRWHNSPQAKDIRRNELATLKGYSRKTVR